MSGRPRSRTATSYGAASARATADTPSGATSTTWRSATRTRLIRAAIFGSSSTTRTRIAPHCAGGPARSRAGGLVCENSHRGLTAGWLVPADSGATRPSTPEYQASDPESRHLRRVARRGPRPRRRPRRRRPRPGRSPVAAEPVVGARRRGHGRAARRSSRSTPSTSLPQATPEDVVVDEDRQRAPTMAMTRSRRARRRRTTDDGRGRSAVPPRPTARTAAAPRDSSARSPTPTRCDSWSAWPVSPPRRPS